MTSKPALNFSQVSGEPYEIGYRLGEIARPVFAGYMEQSSAWRAVRRWPDRHLGTPAQPRGIT